MPEPKIQFIIENLQENLEVEVKNWLKGLRHNAENAKLAKEIIALANHGGGYVFIGFDEEPTGHPELSPSAGELEAFSQDNIASIVDRYVTPPFQCSVDFHQPEGSQISHPVITVPGGHRTPVWAARQSPDGGRTLQVGTVYVRRPGGSSEPARTQDDWEKLIDRLVAARQADMLGAIREILNPSAKLLTEKEEEDVKDWQSESYGEWQNIISQFEADDPRRLERGHWTVSFSINPFDKPELNRLNEALEREMPKLSGWPPFTYIHRDPVRPRAQGDLITSYLGGLEPGEQPQNRRHADFWRVSRIGKGFMLRPMQEDRNEYASNTIPRVEGPFFDWVLPIYRMTEVLKFIEALGVRFAPESAAFELSLSYYHTTGRWLRQSTFKYHLDDGATCHVDHLQSSIGAQLSEISTNMEELVFALLSPIYEQFDFTRLPRPLVTNVVAEALAYPR